MLAPPAKLRVLRELIYFYLIPTIFIIIISDNDDGFLQMKKVLCSVNTSFAKFPSCSIITLDSSSISPPPGKNSYDLHLMISIEKKNL